jgi:hypothetical protein
VKLAVQDHRLRQIMPEKIWQHTVSGYR